MFSIAYTVIRFCILCSDSQGFCCACPSFGGDDIARGYRECSYSLSWLSEGTPGSAHCLRYDETWWYRGYRIGKYQVDFQLQVHIHQTYKSYSNTTEEELNSTSTTSLVLSPSQMSARNSDIHIEMVGDFASYAEIESLRDHWLMIPIQPGLSPNEIFSSNLDMWMVFPSSKVSTQGECDKIGVSYTSFKFQPDRCSKPFGSCLSNQIYHFEMEDQSRLSRGLTPLYNIQRYGGGPANQGQMSQVADGLSLKLPLIQMRTSLVQLTIKADDLQYVTNIGQGVVVSSGICNYAGTACGQFEAISEIGYLQVLINNTITEDAMIYVSVMNCSANILPVLQQSAAVKGLGIKRFTFQLRATTDLASNCSCNITVSNALAVITDTAFVEFSLSNTKYSPQPDQSEIDDLVRCSVFVAPVSKLPCMLFFFFRLKSLEIRLNSSHAEACAQTYLIFDVRSLSDAGEDLSRD
jgi:hypothetical protein